MDKGSELLLGHVHPKLAQVIKATSQTPQAFAVVYDIRTLAAEAQAVKTGHSQTMHSRHLPNKEGLSCAVDVAALANGHIDWAKGKEQQVYGQIWKQIEEAATKLGVTVEWGGNWHSFKDWSHIQLPWELFN